MMHKPPTEQAARPPRVRRRFVTVVVGTALLVLFAVMAWTMLPESSFSPEAWTIHGLHRTLVTTLHPGIRAREAARRQAIEAQVRAQMAADARAAEKTAAER
jgi:hypothetical protein